jgi:hypothetical protein
MEDYLATLSVVQLMVIGIGLALFSMAVSVLIVMRTWPKGFGIREFARGIRELVAVRWRMVRDPAYRKRMAAADKYMAAACMMFIARSAYQSVQQEPSPKEGREDARERRLANALETVLDVRKGAVSIVLDLDDEALPLVAEGVRERWLRNTGSVDDIVAFLKEEQALLKESPYLMDTHLLRFTQRFSVPDERSPS